MPSSQDRSSESLPPGGGGSTIEVTVDPDLCMGAGECVFVAPGTFELDAARKSHLRADRDEGGEADDVVVEAARACPNFAITVVRDGQQVV